MGCPRLTSVAHILTWDLLEIVSRSYSLLTRRSLAAGRTWARNIMWTIRQRKVTTMVGHTHSKHMHPLAQWQSTHPLNLQTLSRTRLIRASQVLVWRTEGPNLRLEEQETVIWDMAIRTPNFGALGWTENLCLYKEKHDIKWASWPHSFCVVFAASVSLLWRSMRIAWAHTKTRQARPSPIFQKLIIWVLGELHSLHPWATIELWLLLYLTCNGWSNAMRRQPWRQPWHIWGPTILLDLAELNDVQSVWQLEIWWDFSTDICKRSITEHLEASSWASQRHISLLDLLDICISHWVPVYRQASLIAYTGSSITPSAWFTAFSSIQATNSELISQSWQCWYTKLHHDISGLSRSITSW